MTTRRQVMNALAKVGGTLDDVGFGIFVIDSAPGKLWHTSTHSIQVEWRYELGEPKSDLWRDLLDDIKQGVLDCDGWQDGIEAHGVCERCLHDGIIYETEDAR